ncbi:ArsR family transcriptional regulator [Cohaesibacter sp. CAU 1516]|uniref:ArsR/SmtB family transcription factor n=1 Tax=Cohaesibacter sp. CAU 1516 TaxID=2576038 RepID=UPI0010FF31D2|nr:metalloregulator ArsR/SmtB family transcription factor [Cohaesibacter sp. CAU 1516]TLP43851.1 ArsR family transcriptional regulator [Cohaesibacter sp. CAU 1516]
MNDYLDCDQKSIARDLSAVANENRLRILHWLAEPERHFPPQVDGDLINDGVCVGFITEKIGLKQPTVTNHMRILQEAGLVESKKVKNWVFYKLRQERVEQLLAGVALMIRSNSPT